MWFSSPEKNYSDINAGDHRPMKEWKVTVFRTEGISEEPVYTEKLMCKYEPRMSDEPFKIYYQYLKDNQLCAAGYCWKVEEVK